MPPPSDADWVLPLLHKHTCQAMAILGELILAGMATGTCSVNDISTIPGDKSLPGACMKLLKHMGFRHSEDTIPAIRMGKKGKVSVWILEDEEKAQTYLDYQMQYFYTIFPKP